MLLLPLDDLLAMTREFLNPDVSRSGLSRRLRRHDVRKLNALKPKEPTATSKGFKAYEHGFLHIDVKYLPQMPDETGRRYLFVEIDRATRWVFVRVMSTKTATNARRFLTCLIHERRAKFEEYDPISMRCGSICLWHFLPRALSSQPCIHWGFGTAHYLDE